ncbi:MAG: cation:proton antiporter regulatory subunit [Limnochordia bacterium]
MATKDKKWPIYLVQGAQALTIGLSYYVVQGFPGLTSSFVAIFVALLPFDLIVAMPKIWFAGRYWGRLMELILPRITGTIITLFTGLALGLFFGLLTYIGLPNPLAAVLLVGIAYTLCSRIPGNITSFVGVIGGLAIFEVVTHLPGTWTEEFLPTAWTMALGTFKALMAGWAVGIIIGLITRLLLPRGYRTLRSSAYALPLEMQPFRQVLKVERDVALAEVKVTEDSPFVNRSLRELSLREGFMTNVIVIHRQGKDVPVPGGDDVLQPGDEVLLLGPAGKISQVVKLLKGSAELE